MQNNFFTSLFRNKSFTHFDDVREIHIDKAARPVIRQMSRRIQTAAHIDDERIRMIFQIFFYFLRKHVLPHRGGKGTELHRDAFFFLFQHGKIVIESGHKRFAIGIFEDIGIITDSPCFSVLRNDKRFLYRIFFDFYFPFYHSCFTLP